MVVQVLGFAVGCVICSVLYLLYRSVRNKVVDIQGGEVVVKIQIAQGRPHFLRHSRKTIVSTVLAPDRQEDASRVYYTLVELGDLYVKKLNAEGTRGID